MSTRPECAPLTFWLPSMAPGLVCRMPNDAQNADLAAGPWCRGMGFMGGSACALNGGHVALSQRPVVL